MVSTFGLQVRTSRPFAFARLTAGKEERAATPRRSRRVDLGVQDGRMPTAVLKVERKQLDDLFDRDNLFFKERRRHPLFDDNASKRQDCVRKRGG